ncbi:galactose mutarotase [Starkeya sp. ORNL1]|uniref:aldose epimerase family protein n=1 Tax=Starkeya sp. ORNL1 TaxID=2709380 RepID=UPI00146440D2|nr:aldose epimerase family protein [Starkeya sp. ORNL1]QJP15929.1 galactose mutarotase [Starkeya sp. ORNL1]
MTQPEEPFEEIELRAGDAVARVLSFGAVLHDLIVPAPSGPRRVVLGFEDAELYRTNPPHLGATCGRVANRIGKGRFTLDGTTYQLALNERGRTHLHGGERGFDRRPWRILARDAASVTLGRTSPDGEEGYPGTVEVRCTYRLCAPGTLRIEMEATTDRTTPVNLAHHSYFTLEPGASVRGLTVEVAAGRYTPTDADLIPTGEILGVASTPYDLTTPRRLDGDATHYDLNYVLDRTRIEPGGDRLAFAARARAADGLTLEVWTSEPGLQLYDGAKLAEGSHGLGGQRHGAHAGICFEAQNFPDAPNHPDFPSPWLRPGERYRQVTEYRFG